MREIKFRQFVDCSVMMEFSAGEVAPYPIDKNPIMQYTGLKDRNGVEIYEGDVVMCYPDKIEICYVKVVEWDEGSPSLGITTNGRSGATLCKGNQDILEVVGNIHMNPELLEKQQ